jgi:hypothetical protein
MLLNAGDVWRLVKYRNAVVVDSREAFDAALARSPRYIAVEGSEALRSYAASLAYRGGQEAARLEAAARTTDAPAYMMLPTVGRIRDGYRRRGAPMLQVRDGTISWRLPAGMGTVLAACGGVVAALLGEWLSYQGEATDIVRGPHRAVRLPDGNQALPTRVPAPSLHSIVLQVASVALLMLAAAALGYLVWQAFGAGRGAAVSWRVDHRVPGRLVIARIRTALG